MQRPVPGEFQGSIPADIVSAKLGSDIERGLGGFALTLAFAASILTLSLSDQSPWLAMRIGCSVLLSMSLLGLWLRSKAAQAPQREIMGIYQAVLRRIAHGNGAVGHAPAEGGFGGLAGLIMDLTWLLRRTQAGRTRLEAALAAGQSGLQEGRRQATRIASEIGIQATTLSDAESQVSSTELQLVRGAESAVRSLDTADNAVTRAIDGIATVAESVRATTSGAQQMTMAAVQMAEIAHGTHRCIASLDDQTAKMVVALDHIEHSLLLAASLGQSASSQAAALGVPSSSLAHIASQLKEVAGSCKPALADAGSVIRELASQTAEANRRTVEIAELVGANHDIGRAVSHAVERQGQEIARVLTELYEARPGFATLRAAVEAVTLACVSRTDAADAIRNVAWALPTQAENLAKALRSLPDLPRPTDH